MQVLSLIEASEAVLEEKQWQQFAASGSCTVSTNEKPRSIVPECSRPIAIVPKPGGGGPKSLFSDGAQFIYIPKLNLITLNLMLK